MTAYIIDGDYVVGGAAEPVKRYYLREVVDPYFSEYTGSCLTDDQRRAIFEGVGIDALTDALKRLFTEDKYYHQEDAAQTVKLVQWKLYGSHPA